MSKKISDLERLILGIPATISEQNILGLKDYIEYIEELLNANNDIGISKFFNHKCNKMTNLLS